MTPDTSALTDEGLNAHSLLQKSGSWTRMLLTESPDPEASLVSGSNGAAILIPMFCLALMLLRAASCPEKLPSSSVRTWLPHTCMMLSAFFSAFLALSVDVLGKEGVSASDPQLCSVVLRFPMTLAAVVLQREHVLGVGGEGRPRSALLLQGFWEHSALSSIRSPSSAHSWQPPQPSSTLRLWWFHLSWQLLEGEPSTVMTLLSYM
ncbi:unnamed protein product [Polarella glacialis]|uniref:Uncharacterized protein n=1 Tax=Polarella glacialis TaxID=89957 RepID=A0A813F759_POLGL|nr:unnamed protein product [Polarella glacialis]